MDLPNPTGSSGGKLLVDRQLVRAAALGDADAWDELVDVHAPALWAHVRGAGLGADEATAVCELVWVRLAQALPDLGGEPLSGWLHRTAATETEHAHVRAGRAAARPSWTRDRRRQPREQLG